MKPFFFPFLLVWLTLSDSQATPSSEGAPFYLEPGEQRSLGIPALRRFSLSGDAIRHHRIPGTDRILIKAMKPGLSTLWIEKQDGSHRTHLIRVETPKNRLFPSELLRTLNRLEHTEVLHSGARLLLRGTVTDPEEAEAIRITREAFPDLILDLTRIEENWLRKSRIELEKAISNHTNLRVSEGEGILQVEGSVTSEAEREQVFRKIRRIQPLTRILLAIGKDSDPTLHFKIFLLETRKDLSGSVGIPWPAEFSKSSPLRPLELLFRALSEKGTVRILSSPELSVKCPGKAELFAGGEIPIRQRNRFNETVQWKNVGLSLRLDVLEFKKDRIRLSIETELSHLASELQNDQIPGLRSNRIRTEVEGALDRPLLLSGLLQEDLREQARGFPGLSSVPVLGSLFGSSDFQDRKTELSAVLLPQGSPAASPMKSIDPGAPDGWIPPFRNRIPAFELEQLRKSAEFPWNVL